MHESDEIDAELHRHAAALRGIARDLLRDPHAADDVTQQTLHRALAQRDLRPGPLGGWLQRTLVNFTHQWRRDERRRAAREAQLPTPEPTREPAETLSRRETLRAVTDAVLALDEPYQTAIFLRYFENLPPRAICRRTGANLATVKSRLQRGLTLLRAQLDRQCNGDRDAWRMSLLFAFGLPASAAAAGLTLTGAWLLGTTAKTLVAAGLLCAGGLFVYSMTQAPPPLQSDVAQKTDRTAAEAQASKIKSKGDGPIREAVPETDAADTAWLDHPYLLELDALVIDDLGLPVQGRTLRLAPPGCTLDDASTSTGPDGRVTLSWRSRTPNGEVTLVDERGTLRRIALQHGTKTRVTLGQSAPKQHVSSTIALRVLAKTSYERGVPVLEELPVVGTLFTGSGDGEATMRSGMHPFAVFGDGALVAKPLEKASIAFSMSEGMVTLTITDSAVGKPATPPPQLARIAGTVFGEDGKPVAGGPVVLLTEGPQPLARTTTDEHGLFSFDNLRPGEFRVRAGGNDRGLATTTAITTTGVTPTTLNLHRDSCIRGRAVDAAGKPLVGASIGWRAADGTWCDVGETGDDGSFVLANLPGTAGTVLLWEPSGKFPLPVRTETNVLANTTDLLLTFDGSASSAAQFELGLPDGIDADGVCGRVWNLDTGIGADMKRPEAGKPWRMENLPAGWYRFEAFAPSCGWLDLGRHWLDGKADCNLGHADLPAPATVQLAFDPTQLSSHEQQAIELYELRTDVDVRLEGAALKADSVLRLPRGNYVIAWRDKDGGVHFDRFSVRSGETRIVPPEH